MFILRLTLKISIDSSKIVKTNDIFKIQKSIDLKAQDDIQGNLGEERFASRINFVVGYFWKKLRDIIIFNGMENWKSFMLKLLWDVRLISYPMLDCRIDLQCSPSHLVNFIQSVSEKNKIMERSRKALFLSVMNIMYCLEEDLEQANSVCKHGFLCAGGFYKKKKLLNISDAVP